MKNLIVMALIASSLPLVFSGCTSLNGWGNYGPPTKVASTTSTL